ncbi:hypothetical protein MRB53_027006 [Persea americana]|uniref:Uncharacterized protein n=1 Tax=Persea americana TaxID=3435 RepID=A0ACC2LJY4_PERAE|nr:hypothetical protein MRB53_027006 [Persea americana]
MGSWERYQKDHFQQESHWKTSASKYNKPPSGWLRQPTVPSWEKRFCTSVCKIPWRKICESKRFEASYKSIIEWNDSAGKEAVQNAKSRYWAEINGLPRDIPLPDPDLYIDVIDWSSSIDPKLLSALDGERTLSEQDEDDVELEILDSGLWNQPIIPTGWGDDDDNLVMRPNNTMTHGGENYNRIAGNSNIWDHSGGVNKVDKAWESDAVENRVALINSYGNADSSNLMRGLTVGNNAWGQRIQESKPRTKGGVNGGRNVKVVENDKFRKNGADWRTGAGYWRKKERRPAYRAN